MQKCFGGNDTDAFCLMYILSDSVFLFGGQTNSNNGDVSGNHGAFDYWLVKTDFNLNIIWSKCYGGTQDEGWPLMNNSELSSVNNSSYLFSTSTYSNNGDVSGNHGLADIWVVNTDSTGVITRQHCYGSTNGEFPGNMILGGSQLIGVGLTTGIDGDVSGNHNVGWSDIWYFKTDSLGAFQFQKCFGGSFDEIPSKIIQLSDNSYYISGSAYSDDFDVTINNGGYDYWSLMIDSAADIIWQRSSGGSSWEGNTCAVLCNDGGLLIGGQTASNDIDVSGNHGNNDIWIVKLDSLGNLIWQHCYGGTGFEYCYNISKTSDNGYLIAGSTNTNNDGDVTGNHGLSKDAWIIKIDSVGNIVWEKCLGGVFDEEATSVTELSNKSILVTGFANSNNGDVSGNNGSQDAWVVLLDSVVATGLNEQNSSIRLSVYPNPSKDQLTVSGLNSVPGTIFIYDTNGTCLFSQQFTSIAQTLQISTVKFPSGMYSLKFVNNSHAPTLKKFVVIH